jgi:hypothetical protein
LSSPIWKVPPRRVGSSDDPDGEGDSVGVATGLAGASVDAGLGPTGSGDWAGLVETADADAGADAANSTSSCIAPADPAVVDEHPATAAVTSTNPTVSSFRRVLISHPDLSRRGMRVIPTSL